MTRSTETPRIRAANYLLLVDASWWLYASCPLSSSLDTAGKWWTAPSGWLTASSKGVKGSLGLIHAEIYESISAASDWNTRNSYKEWLTGRRQQLSYVASNWTRRKTQKEELLKLWQQLYNGSCKTYYDRSDKDKVVAGISFSFEVTFGHMNFCEIWCLWSCYDSNARWLWS